MKRFVFLGLVTAALSVNASAQALAPQANPPATAPAAGEAPGIFAPKKEEAPATNSEEPRRRAISSEAATALSAAMPKYSEVTPRPAQKRLEEEEKVDMRDVDKPRNNIPRLNPVIVRERKPAILSERAVTTDKGLEDIAVRRYISEMDRVLNRFNIPFVGASMQSRAMAMYEEDERLKNMSDLKANAV
ncbi:MAG TPA: hypothetical protein VGE76_18875, partial [Opitutaceae bacterium]